MLLYIITYILQQKIILPALKEVGDFLDTAAMVYPISKSLQTCFLPAPHFDDVTSSFNMFLLFLAIIVVAIFFLERTLYNIDPLF